MSGSFEQINKLKVADPSVDLTARSVATCDNPTFDAKNLNVNHLAEIAPNPPACDNTGAGPCSGAGDSGTGKASTGGTSTPTTNSGTSSNGSTGTNGSTTTTASAKPTATKKAVVAVDPSTGQVVAAGVSSGDQAGADAVPVDLSAYQRNGLGGFLGVLAVALLLLTLVLPPILVRRFNKAKP